MYLEYWKLNRRPFENNSSPEFFYRSQTHRAALLKLRYAVENRLGAAILAGGIGHGKTCLVSMLARELPKAHAPVVHLLFPQMSAGELLAYLAVELGADEATVGDGRNGLDRTVRQIERQMTSHAEAGCRPVIVLDEAHFIEDRAVFQALGLLLNFARRGDLDFSLLFVGQPTLLPRIDRIGQLSERVAVRSILQPLSHEETLDYVRHRLQIAGAPEPIFEREALDTLFELSGGVPQRINRLCDLALLVGYADRLTAVTAGEIEAVAEELVAVVPS